MARKLGPKWGQIDLHEKPKSSFGEIAGGIAVAIFVILVLVNLAG